MAKIRLYKRNSTFVELPILVEEELSNIGLHDTSKKILYNEPIEYEAKSIIVAGPAYLHTIPE